MRMEKIYYDYGNQPLQHRSTPRLCLRLQTCYSSQVQKKSATPGLILPAPIAD